MNKTRIGKNIVIILLVSSIVCSSMKNYAQDVSVKIAYTTMTLNTIYSGYLASGSVDSYYFTPSQPGLYVIETFGSTDTKGSIMDVIGVTSSVDDNSGKGTNFSIDFLQNANKKANISVWHANSPTGSGAYTIRVRKPKAQIYTANYGSGDINTIPDAKTPKETLESIGFVVEDNQNQSVTYAMETIENAYKRFNSEIVFYSGHGTLNGGGLLFANGDILMDINIGTTSYLGSDGMSNTKVAVWSACESAATPKDSVPRVSIAEKAYELGAEISIGWTKKINVKESKDWTDAFWTALSIGKTVGDAILAANEAVYSGDPVVTSLKFFGNENIVINLPNTNVSTLSVSSRFNSVNENEFNNFLEEFSDNYIEEDYMGLCTYYYKTINGYKTNEYYRVLKDRTIEKNPVSITKEEIEKAEELLLIDSQYKTPVENDFGQLEDTYEYIDYIKLKGEIIPVKTIFENYVNDKGYTKQEVTCINLLNDEFLDYEELWNFN